MMTLDAGISGSFLKKLRNKVKKFTSPREVFQSPKKHWRKIEKQYRRSAQHLAAAAPIVAMVPGVGTAVAAGLVAGAAYRKVRDAKKAAAADAEQFGLLPGEESSFALPLDPDVGEEPTFAENPGAWLSSAGSSVVEKVKSNPGIALGAVGLLGVLFFVRR